jgi:hypothetical protein
MGVAQCREQLRALILVLPKRRTLMSLYLSKTGLLA